jgi:hypothetical protein
MPAASPVACILRLRVTCVDCLSAADHCGRWHLLVLVCAQVKSGDRVYVCSTGDGAILELSYPDMSLVRHRGCHPSVCSG